ncbi:MAG: response regulator [Nitrospirota bacterium]
MKKVLVIEDNKENRRLITYIFQRAGYEVISAETGEKGVELALREKPHLIIMDIALPGIDGIETTIRIREAGLSDVPIIAVTSYAMLGDREKILKAGCNGYLEKPFDPITMVEKIQQIIGARRFYESTNR